MKIVLSLSITFIFLGSALASATTLNPYARLRKMSRIIRGVDPGRSKSVNPSEKDPNRSEYQDLSDAIKTGTTEQFFERTAKAYARSQQHYGKMMERLYELYRLRYSAVPYEQANTEVNMTSTDRLFWDVVHNNASWDLLMTSNSYVVNKLFDSDVDFYESIFGDRIDSAQPQQMEIPISGEPNDPRLAGVWTSSRLAARYTNTTTNKNRRRAAALFRVALCDDMKPAVNINQGDFDRIFSVVFNDLPSDGKQKNTLPSFPDEKRHGSDPICAACHYKLDPAGKTFNAMGSTLGPLASPGALVFRRKDGSLVQVKAKGLGDLTRAIVQEPEYAQCQVRHFWDWFIGNSNDITDQQMEELVAAFNRMGRRTDDFVAYLVNRPEFYRTSEANSSLFEVKVKPVLMRCNQCHMGLGGQIPNLSSLPIGGNDDTNRTWISKMAHMLDLKNNGKNHLMPPSASGWDISTDSLQSIKIWISTGAKNSNGVPTLTPEQVHEIIGVAK